ncbi:hypothetical protein, partial [Elstera litoralis]|uniref:hypothetical protein n=1 Tax=Elstera litoralis TaxID=552518 RepID=UPI001E2AA12B
AGFSVIGAFPPIKEAQSSALVGDCPAAISEVGYVSALIRTKLLSNFDLNERPTIFHIRRL